jgi:hypothetical protein
MPLPREVRGPVRNLRLQGRGHGEICRGYEGIGSLVVAKLANSKHVV